MARLKGLDASFLYFETPETPMHVAGCTLFDLPEAYKGRFHQVYRDFLATRLQLADIFTRKLANTTLALDHPAWVTDKTFDLDYHVRGVMLPAPGDFAQLEATVARLHGELLDRSRPLWQFTIIEGLADGRAALYSKVHHAALDGGAGMVLTQAMYDVSPQPRPPLSPVSAPLPVEQPSALAGLGGLYVDFLRRQVDQLNKFPDLLRAANNLLLPKIPEDAKLSDLIPKRDSLPKLPPLISPRTVLNVQITAERSYAARSLPLAPARRLAKASGAKLNDIVMAVCAGALRRYLLDRKALPRRQLTAFVPISLRELGNTDMTNQVTGMICGLATHLADPVARLRAIVESSRNSKRIAGEIKDATPTDFSFIGAPVVLSTLSRLYGRSGVANWVNPPCNVVISNVPGPPVPLFCAEAKVSGLYPVSIPAHGVALNITVQSYVDHLDFGLTADRRAVPDIARLADYMAESFKELADAISPPAPANAPAAAAAPPAAAEDPSVVPMRKAKAQA